jgi:hypothetical protein
MTFLSGWRLVLLVAPAALLVAYLMVQRRRHRQVLRFTSVEPTGRAQAIAAAACSRRSNARLARTAHCVRSAAMATRIAKQRATILLTLDTSVR